MNEILKETWLGLERKNIFRLNLLFWFLFLFLGQKFFDNFFVLFKFRYFF